MSRELEGLGRMIAERVRSESSPTRRAVLRARFIEAAQARRTHRVPWAGAVVAVASLAVVVLFWLNRSVAQAQCTFVVGDAESPGELGTYYAAPPSGELPLTFLDGSRIGLRPDAGLRVSRSDREATIVLLERGSAQVRVAPRKGRSFRIAAGPYTVQVKGTEFGVSWDGLSGRLEVHMQSGEVLVTGPGLDLGARVSGTERFVSQAFAKLESAAAPGVPSESSAIANEQLGADAGATARAAGDATVAEGLRSAAPTNTQPKKQEPGKTWAQLASAGQYERILRDAEAKGVTTTLSSATVSDLSALANAARFSRQSALAQSAFETLRARFAGTQQATSAAFILGRMADESGRLVSALQWYETYLSEGGPLADEALGRKMTVLHRLGRVDTARQVATQYLSIFPHGPYASHASNIAR